ncbi:methyl-accepting chemotaxis protein [Coralloluteibacterium thermophilus]|uniref:Methyl-accepting chemotaxis protein n=1 Tax=Coralloluteibacterium thermophilum TaxID=2707049 RepID=A0ABV9NJZ1_9GAMM
MRWFNDLSITRKLLAGISLAALLTLTLGVTAVNRLTQANADASYVVTVNVPQVQAIGDLRGYLGELRTYELSLLATQNYDEYTGRVAAMEQAIAAARNAYAENISAGTDRDRYDAARAAIQAYLDASSRLLQAAGAGDYETAALISDGESRPLRRTAFEALDALAAHDRERMDARIAAADATFRSSRVLLGALTVAAILIALGAGAFLAYRMGRALRQATAVSAAIADGRFDSRIDIESRDETGQLLASMQRMQSTLQEYSRAQLEMGARHDAGEISHRIDAAAFRGAYGEMAANTNALVDSHIVVMNEMAGLAQRYAIGDLSEDMRDLPGEKAAITEAMRATKQNLDAVNLQIKALADAAARGDFSERGDEAKYQYAFREMVAALNRLMQEADAGLSDVGRIMGALADGDLTQRVEREYQGAFGRLAADANRTVAQLTGIVRGIKDSVETINTASGEIASGNADLSSRTEQQAASLEETASSMEELTSTVRQNAENARQANQLAVGAGDVAEAGGRVVDEVVTTMGAISESSKRIADIIGVIDGIAFQTNILALNAAVEAARAGEQGRGFAVVASEVRSLAQRSADAAKEIKTLIEDSAEKVELGSSLVHRAGTTMGEIVTSVKRVTDIMGEITAASAEQSSGIDQVNRTVMQLDEVTQQNAALVEEASAAARSLEEQAGGLAQAVAVFRLVQGATVQPAVKTPAPAAPAPKPAPRPAARAQAETAPAQAPAARPAPARAPKPAPQPALAEADGEWQEF